MQLLHAVSEHGGIRRRHIEPAGIDLGDVGQHLGGGGAIPGDQDGQIVKQGPPESIALDPQVRQIYLGEHFELR